ncbi:MAG: undecaprenyl-phosphate galactose phosphotransferase WbaP [Anaerolineales bacterium]|nr:undecaprenyl-phosphate galactose phosphotransferase WbaP [Anaerolineales bacterium]
MVLISSDFTAIVLAGFFAIAIRLLFGDPFYFELFAQVIPIALICIVVYALQKLYPGSGYGPVEELRLLSVLTSVVILSMAAVTFWARNAEAYSRLTFAITWVLSLGFVPLGRALTRMLMEKKDAWGIPAIVVGFDEQGSWIVDLLSQNPKFGWKPVAVIGDAQNGSNCADCIPYFSWKELDASHQLPVFPGVDTAIVIMSEVPDEILNGIVENPKTGYEHLILIPNPQQIVSLGVTTCDLGGMLGLNVRRNLLNRGDQLIKRLVDLALTISGVLVISPLLLFIATLIKLESRGKVFFGHERLGRDGDKFTAWKFRTMVADADAALEHYLAKNPELRAEWEENRKLKNDPRITRIGKFLRKTSLDELPQIWNVLKGEMSLVGPRPIVEEEVPYYGSRFKLLTFVPPGITGLWQVSGRTDTSYDTRVRLDEYYVRNWSIWLDVSILMRTIWVVFRGEGAY